MLYVWSLHDYTTKRKPFDGNTTNEKHKNPWSCFVLIHNIFLVYFKWKMAVFSVYIILACSLNKVVSPFPCEWVILLCYDIIRWSFDTKLLCTYNQTSVVRLRGFGFYNRKERTHWPKIEYHAKYIKESLISYTRKTEVQVARKNILTIRCSIRRVQPFL